MRSSALRKIDLNLLKVFDAIYAERHVTRAAARLFTSQSAVSHSLRNLRYIFQDPLFIRTPDGMSPTALADLLAERVGRVLDEMQDVLSFRSEFDPLSAEGKITIGLLSPSPPWLLAGICRVMREQAPQLTIAFRMIGVETVADVLDDRTMQLVIGAPNRVHDRRRFSHEPLYEDSLTCFVGTGNRLVGAALDLETYALLPHVAIATEPFERTWIDDVLAESGLRRNVRILAPSPAHVGDLLSSSDLICTILPSLIMPDARLRALPPPFAAQPMAIGQFSHSRDEDNPQIRWLRGVVRDVCRETFKPLDIPPQAAP